ncbi:hypothetical protein [Streptomyces sp. CAU 1734]|uniref:hypothetical protein n=1 Tax=Streptomyces sp. CAU 1734 TaxID=3140360 RepID=UPI003260C625
MRASRALAVAAVTCAAVGLSAPVATAGGDRQDTGPIHVSVHPHSVHQGGTLTITVHGCSRGGTVTSNAFPRTSLHRGDSRGDDRGDDRGDARGDDRGDGRGENRENTSTATARIHDHASPGHYNLAARCNNNPGIATAQFTVVSGRGALGGLGGSMGPSSTEMAVGAGLVGTAAIGGSLFIARRRRTIGGRA